MILKMDHDTYGDFLGYQEWPGRKFNITTLHKTWGTHPADGRGCEALSSSVPHMRTPAFHQKSSKNISWKLARTRMETSWGIRSHQGWHLTPRDVIELNFKKSIFIEISRFWQNRGGCHPSVLGFRTWGGHSWNLRQIYSKPNREFFIWIHFEFWDFDFRWVLSCCVRTPCSENKSSETRFGQGSHQSPTWPVNNKKKLLKQ